MKYNKIEKAVIINNLKYSKTWNYSGTIINDKEKTIDIIFEPRVEQESLVDNIVELYKSCKDTLSSSEFDYYKDYCFYLRITDASYTMFTIV